MKARTAVLAALALVAFAGNSVLCRLALAARAIDAATFTAVRLASGAAILAVLAWRRGRRRSASAARTSWISAVALFAYAAPFSYAYLRLAAGTGALILFGVVQATMIGWGIARGERPRARVWVGLVVAGGGLVALTAPGVSAPDPLGAAGMVVAGASWAIYSLRGRAAGGDPLLATASNFARSLPLAAVLMAIAALSTAVQISPRGLALAVLSGAITSGLGYSLWYAALPALTATRAAVLQLTVPLLAAMGGAMLLGEQPSLRVAVSGAAILGGVALSLRGRA